MESPEVFAIRLCDEINCYYHLTRSGHLISLKKFNTDEHGKMGVFGWIRELKRKDLFEISTYKHLGDDAGVSELADKIKEGMHYISKNKDSEGTGAGIVFFVKKGSKGEDYKKAVKALRAIIAVR